MPGCGRGSWPLPWAGTARQHAGQISGALITNHLSFTISVFSIILRSLP
jgi:hypothetical protein